jgi:GNAT superfamily N-acetyltransferase
MERFRGRKVLLRNTRSQLERLGANDGLRLRAIRLRALLDAPDAFGSTYEEAVARTAESWSEQASELPTFVAVVNGLDVGMVRCARSEADPATAWLISMWVAPDVRRGGVGGALVDAIIEWAQCHNVSRVLLDVADANQPAIALYARKGFQPNGEVSTLPPPRGHIHEHQRELRLK